MVDLGHGHLEPRPHLLLETLQDVPLVLEGRDIRQVQLDEPERDARSRHGPLRRAVPLQRARHFLARVHLEDVPGLNAVDAVDADPALDPGEDLADVVLEALQ